MKYLKKVQNVEEYNTFIVSSAFTLPNVTKIVNAGGGGYEMKYNPKEEGNYLWFFALSDGDISFTIPANNPTANFPYISYSTDNGETWTTETHSDGVETVVTVHLSAADSVMFKAECVSGTNWNSAGNEDSSYPARFSSTMPVNLGGNLASLMYGDDFEGKTTLKTTARFPFFGIFYGCNTLISAKNLYLPFESTTNYGLYQNFFGSCTNLVEPPSVLPAKTLGDAAYNRMFDNCTSLTNMPSMLATTLGLSGCAFMFKDCRQLTGTTELKATTLKNYCYYGMFSACTNLLDVPNLPANTMASYCYGYMFASCSKLTGFPATMKTSLATYCYDGMFHNCGMLTDANCPSLPATTLSEGCYRNMFSWCRNTGFTTGPTLNATTMKKLCYYGMFKYSSIKTPPAINSTSLAVNCYEQMFASCTGLTNMPSLPANTLQNYCYRNMFSGCTSLTTVTGLNATTLGQYCYSHMFDSCTGITTVQSALPATTLQKYCYEYMFYKCTNLVTAPDLPALTLPNCSLQYMFNGCSKLNYIKAMFTTTPSNTKNKSWVTGVASSGTFVKNANATWTTTGANGVPTGWSVQTVTP